MELAEGTMRLWVKQGVFFFFFSPSSESSTPRTLTLPEAPTTGAHAPSVSSYAVLQPPPS